MRHNNKKFLKNSQYKDAKNLSARFAIYDFSYPKLNFYDEALKPLKLVGSEKILEVGCGDGKVLVDLKKRGHAGTLVGSDLSKGMYSESVKICKKEKLPIKFIEASADKLPFEAESFDVVLAFFMIYHMPNIDKTLKEWKRILRPGGKLLVAIGSVNNIARRKSLTIPMKDKAGVTRKRFIDSISFETAPEMLEKHFKINKKKLLKYDLRIPDESYIVGAIESTKEYFQPKPSESLWESCMNDIRVKVQKEIKSKGYFHDVAKRGFYICTKEK